MTNHNKSIVGIELETNIDPDLINVSVLEANRYVTSYGKIYDEETNKIYDPEGYKNLIAGRMFKHKATTIFNIDCSGRDGNGIEFRFSPRTYETFAENYVIVKSFLDDLVEYKFQKFGSTTAGIHIHLDRSEFTVKTLELVSRFLSAVKNSFLMSFTNRKSRFTECGGEGFTLKSLSETDFQNYEMNSGRSNIQLNNVGAKTVEFRIFNSVLDPCRFYSFIEFILAVKDYCSQETEKVIMTMQNFSVFVAEHRPEYYSLIRELTSWGFISKVPTPVIENASN